MKAKLLSASLLVAFATFFQACTPDEEVMTDMDNLQKASVSEAGTGCEVITFDHYTRGQNGFVTQVRSNQNSGPILVSAYRRTSNNTYINSNVANIFDSNRKNVGNQVNDILTPHMDFGGGGEGDGGKATSPFKNDTHLGNLMIINRTDNANQAYDNNHGGKMVFDFSALGTVTMTSVTVMDIDNYEAGSKVVLYGANNAVLKEVQMQVSGNNGKQIVNLGNTSGVVRMEIFMGPANSPTGSGAIDNIMFCVDREPEYGCTYTQGYWKNHAEGRKYDATWRGMQNETFYGSNMSYLQLMRTAPKGGNAYIILAHQYIAAVLNTRKASAPAEVDAVIARATAYFSAKSGNVYRNTINSPYTTVNRNTLIQWADLLASYNEGKIGPGHCD